MMQDNLNNILTDLKQIADQANAFNEPVINKDKRKKHDKSELVINSTVAVIGMELRAVEYHLGTIESLMNGLEEFINDKD